MSELINNHFLSLQVLPTFTPQRKDRTIKIQTKLQSCYSLLVFDSWMDGWMVGWGHNEVKIPFTPLKPHPYHITFHEDLLCNLDITLTLP